MLQGLAVLKLAKQKDNLKTKIYCLAFPFNQISIQV